MLPDYLDAGTGNLKPQSAAPDLSKTAAQAAAEVSKVSKSSYDVVIDNIDLNLFKSYGFIFNYLLTNDDPKDAVLKYGPASPRFVVTKEEVNGKIPDNTQSPQNVVTTGGLLSYQVKWDKPLWENYVDTIIWEGTSSSFNGSEPVVWTGTATQANILTSNTNVRYIKIMHRDKFYHAETTSLNKYFISGPITPRDPIVVDASPPANNFTVGAVTVQDDPDGLFTFNKKILFTWTANTDASTYGYQIRFRRLGTTDYTYMSVPGISITSTYLYGVKAGQTYEIGVSTYDQFGNTNTSDWKSYPNIVIPASTSLAADVAITAGDMKMGYGIGGDSANKGLYLGPENYWYIQGNTTLSSAARLSVGGSGDRLLWDGTNLSITGNLTARTGTFTGNILLSSSNASIYNGTINAAGNLTGNGFALNANGLKVANGLSSVTLSSTDGTITANAGKIGGWSLSDFTLSQNNAEISSAGYIAFGSSTPSNMIKITSQDAGYVMWAGNNNGANAPFSVSKTGVLNATGATITGNVTITGGTTKDAITQAQSDATSAYSRAGTAITNAQTAQDRADYVAANAMLETNINTVLAKNTTIIDGSRVTTGTIDVARLNIAGGAASSGNYFKIDGNAIEAYKNYTRTLYIASNGDVVISGNATFSGTLSVGASLSNGGTIGDVKTTASTAATSAQTANTNATAAATSAATANTNATAAATSAATANTNATAAATAAQTANTNATTAKNAADAAKAIADAALPSTSFNRDAIVNSINSATTTTTINGGKITTGTVSANAVVSDFISTFSLNADKITAGTLTGRDISIAGDSSTNRFRTSYDRYTSASGLGPISSLGINAIAMISVNTSGVVSHWYPYYDAESDIGVTTYKWRNIRSNNGTIQTSDIRKKTNIVDSDLGLNFINLLRPVKYNNKYDPQVPEVDENNQPILDENGNRIIKPGQGYIGSRYHYGFIAQEVKSTLDQIGIGDTFSGWTLDDINDETSYQGLSYDKFIAPMAKAIQELSNMVESLQQEINTLKGV